MFLKQTKLPATYNHDIFIVTHFIFLPYSDEVARFEFQEVILTMCTSLNAQVVAVWLAD